VNRHESADQYVINTHYHADHSGGNGKMVPGGVEIISTANSRRTSWSTSSRMHRRMSYRRGLRLRTKCGLHRRKGSARKVLRRGHTNGDAVIYFPADRTIHTGDLMAGTSPLIDYNGGGSLVEWTKTLDAAMKQLDFRTVHSGHGM